MIINEKQLNWLKEIFRDKLPEDFTGNIQVNFFCGKMGVVNIQQSFKPAEK